MTAAPSPPSPPAYVLPGRESPASPAVPPRLDALTPLRFVAAVFIVIVHGALVFGVMPGTGVIYAAHAGVSFFFVMSGFVLAYNYPVLADRAAVGRFRALRFARIWPMYAVVLAATMILIPTGALVPPGVDPRLAAVLAFALLQSWVPINGYAVAYVGPAWTLSVDVFFYAVFPMLLVRVRTAPWRSLAGALLLSLAMPMLANAFGAPRSDLPLDRWNWYMLDHFFPVARLVEFVLGMAAARAFLRIHRRLPSGAVAATLVEAGAIALCIAAIAGLPFVGHAARWVGPGVADWMTQVGAAPCAALLLIALAPGRGAFSRLLSTRVAVHLGDLSYATYLVHLPLLHAPAWPSLTASIGGAPAAAAFAATLLGLSHLLWRHVELPARHVIVRWYDRRLASRVAGPRESQATAPTS